MKNWTFKETEDRLYKYSKHSLGDKKKPYPFKAKLTFDTYSRGRSAVTFWFKDQKGKKYPMFVSDFENILKHVNIDKGKLPRLEYTQTKKGQSIGIRLTPNQLKDLKHG